MPNIPLPPLGARLQPTNLIQPIVRGTSQPGDVIQHQALIDYAQRAQEGIKAMQDLTKSKQIAAQAQAQAEMAKQAQTQTKFYNDYVKMTMARTDIPEAQKHSLIDLYGMIHGYSYGPEGGTIQPGSYAAPMLSELQKRYVSGNMTPEDLSKSVQNLAPTFLYPASQNNPQTPPAPPAPIKPKVTTTTNGDNSGGDQGGVTGYGGDVGSD